MNRAAHFQHICLILLLTLFSVNSLAEETVYIDVRSADEYQQGHIEGALLMPHTEIGKLIAKANISRDTPIVVYCRSGRRAGLALETLAELGYSNVTNGGGFGELAAELESKECDAESC
jgi:phage shock protein E